MEGVRSRERWDMAHVVEFWQRYNGCVKECASKAGLIWRCDVVQLMDMSE